MESPISCPYQEFRTKRKALAKSLLHDISKRSGVLKEYHRLKETREYLLSQLSLLQLRNENLLNNLYNLKEENERMQSSLSSQMPFEKILSNDDALSEFHKFCVSEHDSENIEFWLEVEKFRRLTSSEERAFMAQLIYDRYISETASHKLNISSSQRNEIYAMLREAGARRFVDKRLFDSIQSDIYYLMRENSFQRFAFSKGSSLNSAY